MTCVVFVCRVSLGTALCLKMNSNGAGSNTVSAVVSSRLAWGFSARGSGGDAAFCCPAPPFPPEGTGARDRADHRTCRSATDASRSHTGLASMAFRALCVRPCVPSLPSVCLLLARVVTSREVCTRTGQTAEKMWMRAGKTGNLGLLSAARRPPKLT
jgi:hypothetical protein